MWREVLIFLLAGPWRRTESSEWHRDHRISVCLWTGAERSSHLSGLRCVPGQSLAQGPGLRDLGSSRLSAGLHLEPEAGSLPSSLKFRDPGDKILTEKSGWHVGEKRGVTECRWTNAKGPGLVQGSWLGAVPGPDSHM